MDDVEVKPGVRIAAREVWFSASRASGPGGQHVNTTDSRITLHWVPGSSAAFTREQRRRVLERLAPRLSTAGELQLHASTHRSQARNREEAIERLRVLVVDALKVAKRRRATQPTRASVKRRLDNKRSKATKKRLRSKVGRDED